MIGIGHAAAAVVFTFCGLDILGAIGVVQNHQGIGTIGKHSRIDPGDMELIALPDPLEIPHIAVHIGQQIQTGRTEVVIVFHQLVQMFVPFCFRAAGYPQGFDDGPGFLPVIENLQIQFADAPAGAAEATLGLIMHHIAQYLQIVPDPAVPFILHAPAVFTILQVIIRLCLDIATGLADSRQELIFVLQPVGGGLVEDIFDEDLLSVGLGSYQRVTQLTVEFHILIVKFIPLAVQLIDQLAGGPLQTHIRHDPFHMGLEHGQIGVGPVHGVGMADEETEGVAVDDHHGAVAQLLQPEPGAGAPDRGHVQFAISFHHEPMEQIVGQIVELHIEFEDLRILLIVRNVHHGILLAEHGDEFIVMAIGEGEVELAHDAQNVINITKGVPCLRQGTADGRIFAGVFQDLIDGFVGDEAVSCALQAVEQDDVQGVGDPVGPEDDVVFQGVVILAVAAEADAQVIEPVEQIFPIFVHLTFTANGLIIVAHDVMALHVLQPVLDLGPADGPLGIQEAGLTDLIQKGIGKALGECFPVKGQGGESDHLGQLLVAAAQIPFIHGGVFVLVDLIQHHQHGGVGGKGPYVMEPVFGPVALGVITGVEEDDVHGPARQEDAVHGVHDLLSAEVPVVDLDLSVAQIVFLVADDDAGGGLAVKDGEIGVAAVVHQPGDGVGLARLAVAQEDHLDLIQRLKVFQFPILEPFQYHLIGLLEDGHVDALDGGMEQGYIYA